MAWSLRLLPSHSFTCSCSLLLPAGGAVGGSCQSRCGRRWLLLSSAAADRQTALSSLPGGQRSKTASWQWNPVAFWDVWTAGNVAPPPAFIFIFIFIFRWDQLKELLQLLLLGLIGEKERKPFFLWRSSLILTDISHMTTECRGVVSPEGGWRGW